MHKGDVYYCPNFKFKDNTTGNKLLIIINEPCPNNGVLYLKVTSQSEKRKAGFNCHSKENYYVTNSAPFTKKTWIQFDGESIFRDTYDSIFNKINYNIWDYQGNYKNINEVVECVLNSPDLLNKYRKLIV